jgi:hypothetical protein
MKANRRELRGSWALFALFALLCYSPLARAQATRTWVSGVGDDANPCSRTAPCKTFAGAISKTAPAGEINVLDPGGFGAVTITKSISIEAEGVIAGVLVSGTNGIVVVAGATDVVTLRGLTIEGIGTGLNGIRFISGAALHVENCTINGFTQQGIDFAPASGATNRLFVKDTKIRHNTGGGIWIEPGSGSTVTASLDNVRLQQNLWGLKAEQSGTVTVSVRNSLAAGNTSNGFVAKTTGATVNLSLESTVVSANGNNGVAAVNAGATVRLSNVSVMDNLWTGLLAQTGGAIISYGNNQVRGNAPDGAPTLTVGQQ